MTPDLSPCPTCKGFCCGSLYHDEWGSPPLRFRHARTATHVCPDCDDGTYEICGDPEPAPKPVRTAEEERAAVLDYLAYRIEMSHYADAIKEFINARYEISEGVHLTINYDEVLP